MLGRIRSSIMRTFAAALAVLALIPAPALAQAQRCAHESFDIQGKTVVVAACPGSPEARSVPITETLKSGSSSLTHSGAIELLPGASVSRGIDDVALSTLGITGTLHLTLAYHENSITIEHAMLLPGAIPLK